MQATPTFRLSAPARATTAPVRSCLPVDRPLHLGSADALHTRQVRGETPARDDSTPPSLLRPAVEVRLQRGRPPRRSLSGDFVPEGFPDLLLPESWPTGRFDEARATTRCHQSRKPSFLARRIASLREETPSLR